MGPGAGVRGFDPEPGERDRSGLQGTDLLHPDDQRGRLLGAARKIYETGANKQTLGNQIVVRPQGELFDFFADITNSSNRRGGIGPVKLSYIRSDDRGQSWTKPVRVDDMIPMSLIREDTPIDAEAVVCPDPSDNGACPIRAGDLLPEVAVDPGAATCTQFGWMLASTEACSLVDHDNIAFTMSTDGGNTWSSPIKVNKTPTAEPNFDQQAFTPSVHVERMERSRSPTTTFATTRRIPATLDTDYFVVSCESARRTVPIPRAGRRRRITPAPFNIRNAPFARGYFLGDYMGLDSAGADFTALFGQAFIQNDANQYFSRLSP